MDILQELLGTSFPRNSVPDIESLFNALCYMLQIHRENLLNPKEVPFGFEHDKKVTLEAWGCMEQILRLERVIASMATGFPYNNTVG